MSEFDFDFNEDNPLGDIIKEVEEKRAQEREEQILPLLNSLEDAIKRTNELIAKSNGNAQTTATAINELQKALHTKQGENIATYIGNQLETHQRAMAKLGVNTLTAEIEKGNQLIGSVNDNITAWKEDSLMAFRDSEEDIDYRLEKLTENISKICRLTDNFIEVLQKPKVAELNWEDRGLLNNVGDKVNKAINRQKWWWVSWGATMILGVAIAVWGVKNLITAGKKEDRAEMIYQNHKYTWSFWYFVEDWGQKNPKTYSSLLSQFKEKYPELSEQYEKEFLEGEDDKSEKEGEKGSN